MDFYCNHGILSLYYNSESNLVLHPVKGFRQQSAGVQATHRLPDRRLHFFIQFACAQPCLVNLNCFLYYMEVHVLLAYTFEELAKGDKISMPSLISDFAKETVLCGRWPGYRSERRVLDTSVIKCSSTF